MMVFKVFKAHFSLIIRVLKQVVIPVSLALSGGLTAQASEQFWQDPLAQNFALDHQSSSNQYSSLTFSEYTDRDGRLRNQTSIAVTQGFGDSSSAYFQYAGAEEQRGLVLGYRYADLSLSYMAGNGEDYAEIGGHYAGIDPYLFHGGWDQKFEYDGFAMDYRLGRTHHLQFGQATVTADGLEDRRARYLEWSNNRVFARATSFSRGGARIGSGFDTGFSFGNKSIAFQAMDLEDDRSMQRLRFQFDGKQSRQYWLDVSSHRNSLYRDNDDISIMFSFKTLLGARSLVSYANEVDSSNPEETAGKKKRSRAINRTVFIGLGVATAAALSSSGSDSQDSTARFNTQKDAAFDVLNGINPTSVRENREYGGWVFVNPDGSYSSTTPVQGEAASVQLPLQSVSIPGGSRATASYHTHAAFDPRFDNENFSPTDLSLNRQFGVDGYLATPGGFFKFHDVRTDTITTLGRIAN